MWKATVHKDYMAGQVKLLIWRNNGDGRDCLKLGNLEIESVTPGGIISDDLPIVIEGMLGDPGGLGQALVDCLWSAGYRPTGGAQFSEQMELKDKHLQDMRAIVEHTLKMSLPKE